MIANECSGQKGCLVSRGQLYVSPADVGMDVRDASCRSRPFLYRRTLFLSGLMSVSGLVRMPLFGTRSPAQMGT